MSTDSNKGLRAFISFVMIVPSVLLQGFTLSTLWLWFAVPALHVPPVSIPHALGLGLLVNVATARYHSATEQDEDERWARGTFGPAVSCIFALTMGAIVRCFE